MMTLEQAFHLAVQHQQAGRLAEAEALYRQILAVHPDHPDALHLLGTVAQHGGRPDLAVEWIGRSLLFQPHFAAAHYNLGNALRELGRIEEAVAAYRRAVELQPDFADAHYNLGIACKAHGQMEAAICAYRRAIELKPQFADAHNNLGIALKDHGRFEEAVSVLRRALELRPNSADTYNNIGQALAGTEQIDEAIAAYRRAIEIDPCLAAAHYNLGDAFRAKAQFDEAIASYHCALERQPGYPEAYNNLGVALKARGRFDEAIDAYRCALQFDPNLAAAHLNSGIAFRERGQLGLAFAALRRAIELQPNCAETLNNLGMAFFDDAQYDQAISAYRRALEIKPDSAEACNNLGNILKYNGQIDDAIAAYRRALATKPDLAEALNNLGVALKDRGELDEAVVALRQSLALDPEQPATHSNLVFALQFDPAGDASATAEEQRRWCLRFSEPLKNAIRSHLNNRELDRRLRIGYVSSDLRNHVVGSNVLPLFAHHDHGKFEIVCYSGVVRPDEWTAEFHRHANLWRSTVGTTDDALATMIRDDEVDVLVDLAQHTAGNRLPVFARRPAPVQVSFAGYPESTGLEAIEYRISDRWLEGERRMPAERSETACGRHRANAECRMPKEHVFLIDTFWCYDPRGTQLECDGLPACERGSVTFGCLSNFNKINEPVLRLWARLLRQIKDARLAIMCDEGSHRERTMQFFQSEEIEAGRIEFFSRCPRLDYLTLYHRLDIVLDPFPYNGHTTSLDALWMGVPIITLAGKTPVSRGGLSILTNIGLPELATHSEEEYLATASQLACDLSRLAELRRTLRSRMEASVLMDAPRFARNIEAAYRAMWREWCTRHPDA